MCAYNIAISELKCFPFLYFEEGKRRYKFVILKILTQLMGRKKRHSWLLNGLLEIIICASRMFEFTTFWAFHPSRFNISMSISCSIISYYMVTIWFSTLCEEIDIVSNYIRQKFISLCKLRTKTTARTNKLRISQKKYIYSINGNDNINTYTFFLPRHIQPDEWQNFDFINCAFWKISLR